MLSTLRILASIFPTWIMQSNHAKFVIFTRNFIKAFIQSHLSNRLILSLPPCEFFEAYLQFIDHVWRALVQIYREVEADLYWRLILVPKLIANIPDLQQSIYDPSLLFIATKMMEILLCAEYTFVVMPESMVHAEASIEKRFECHPREFLQTSLKGIDIIQECTDIILPQMANIYTKGKSEDHTTVQTKLEFHPEFDVQEFSKHLTTAVQVAWIAAGTSPT